MAVKIEVRSNQFSDRSSSWIFHIVGALKLHPLFQMQNGKVNLARYLDFYACELWYSNRFFCLCCISFLAAWSHWPSKALLRILKQVLNNCLQSCPYYFLLYFGLSVFFMFFTFQRYCPETVQQSQWFEDVGVNAVQTCSLAFHIYFWFP